MQRRWARDCCVPFPVWPHQSWFQLDLTEARAVHLFRLAPGQARARQVLVRAAAGAN